jgi:thymidine kinase
MNSTDLEDRESIYKGKEKEHLKNIPFHISKSVISRPNSNTCKWVHISGCMGAGKTTELRKYIEHYRLLRFPVVLFRPSLDDRSKLIPYVTDHNMFGVTNATLAFDINDVIKTMNTVCTKLKTLEREKHETETETERDYYFYDKVVVAIDELHLLKGENIEDRLTDIQSKGAVILTTAPAGDWNNKPFESIRNVHSMADVIYLKGVCAICKNDASHSVRITDTVEQISVGGFDQYFPSCARCRFLYISGDLYATCQLNKWKNEEQQRKRDKVKKVAALVDFLRLSGDFPDSDGFANRSLSNKGSPLSVSEGYFSQDEDYE